MMRKIKRSDNKKRKTSKKGVSEIVSYVLLIVIAISISALVYAWLRAYVPQAKNTCPDEASLIIKDYCFNTGGKYLNMTVQNKGTYTIDAVNIKIANKTEIGKNKTLPIYPLGGRMPDGRLDPTLNGTAYLGMHGLNPGQEKVLQLDYLKYNTITKIQIIPVVFEAESGEKDPDFIFCNKAIMIEDVSSDRLC
jgi:flagellin-like protein